MATTYEATSMAHVGRSRLDVSRRFLSNEFYDTQLLNLHYVDVHTVLLEEASLLGHEELAVPNPGEDGQLGFHRARTGGRGAAALRQEGQSTDGEDAEE
jgi:hypothetical protein